MATRAQSVQVLTTLWRATAKPHLQCHWLLPLPIRYNTSVISQCADAGLTADLHFSTARPLLLLIRYITSQCVEAGLTAKPHLQCHWLLLLPIRYNTSVISQCADAGLTAELHFSTARPLPLPIRYITSQCVEAGLTAEPHLQCS